MPPRAVAVDLTRLATRFGHASPTGIDRVELAYARHYLREAGERFGLVLTALGPRVLERASALDLAETIAAGWDEGTQAEADPVYRRLTGLPPLPARPTASGGRTRRRRDEAWLRLRLLRAGTVDALPRGTAYLHVSHLRLERPERFDWLYVRPDVRAVFLVQDLIPIGFPEYCRPGEAARHALRLETVARHAAHVVVSTDEVGDALGRHLSARGLARPPVTTAPLGIEPGFSRRDDAGPALERPTFLICGTIEPRKNHLLLLNLWRRLAETPRPPRLLVIGRRGWEAEGAIAMLDRCPGLRGHVEEVVGLTTPGLARLMRGATALLMPSFAEGYGLPVLEAAAGGLPVVASDIAVFREIGSGFAQFLDPNDGPGWQRAIEALAEPDSALRASLAGRLAGFEAPGWDGYFRRVGTVLAGL